MTNKEKESKPVNVPDWKSLPAREESRIRSVAASGGAHSGSAIHQIRAAEAVQGGSLAVSNIQNRIPTKAQKAQSQKYLSTASSIEEPDVREDLIAQKNKTGPLEELTASLGNGKSGLEQTANAVFKPQPSPNIEVRKANTGQLKEEIGLHHLAQGKEGVRELTASRNRNAHPSIGLQTPKLDLAPRKRIGTLVNENMSCVPAKMPTQPEESLKIPSETTSNPIAIAKKSDGKSQAPENFRSLNGNPAPVVDPSPTDKKIPSLICNLLPSKRKASDGAAGSSCAPSSAGNLKRAKRSERSYQRRKLKMALNFDLPLKTKGNTHNGTRKSLRNEDAPDLQQNFSAEVGAYSRENRRFDLHMQRHFSQHVYPPPIYESFDPKLLRKEPSFIPSGMLIQFDKRVPIWDRVKRRRVNGMDAPKGRDLIYFLMQNRSKEIYVGQDISFRTRKARETAEMCPHVIVQPGRRTSVLSVWKENIAPPLRSKSERPYAGNEYYINRSRGPQAEIEELEQKMKIQRMAGSPWSTSEDILKSMEEVTNYLHVDHGDNLISFFKQAWSTDGYKIFRPRRNVYHVGGVLRSTCCNFGNGISEGRLTDIIEKANE